MTVRPIRILGQPGDEVLRLPADPVAAIDGSLQTLIDDMIATVRAAPGVGLAAPQVGVPLKLIVINVPEVPAFALINPEVVRNTGRRWLDEGCLSIPGYRGELFRSVRVTVSGLDRRGRRVRVRAVDDLLAQALEHEIDHTMGLLFIDHIGGESHLHRVHAEAVERDELEPEVGDPIEDALRDVLPSRRRGRPPLLTPPRHRHESLAMRRRARASAKLTIVR